MLIPVCFLIELAVLARKMLILVLFSYRAGRVRS